MATVEISDETYELLSKRAEQKDFDDTDEYVEYVLGQVADKVRRKQEDTDRKEGQMSDEDEQKVKDRLRNLGYLD